MALKKNKVNGPILVIEESCGALGSQYLFVTRVTEKLIVCACNEVSEVIYKRKDGYSYETRPSGLAGIARWCITPKSMKMLDAWLAENGKKSKVMYQEYKRVEGRGIVYDYQKVPVFYDCFTYDSGWRSRLNSREEVVRDVPSIFDFKDKVSWFKAQGYNCIKCYEQE